VLGELREEHDSIFGTDVSLAGEKLKKNPDLIKKLPLTLAVINEALRLHPPATTVREGLKRYGRSKIIFPSLPLPLTPSI
jgi:cytochrome P450